MRLFARRLRQLVLGVATLVAIVGLTVAAVGSTPARPRPARIVSARLAASVTHHPTAHRRAARPRARAARQLAVARRALWVAAHQRGKPYVYGASGPGAFDCSGLTEFAYGHAGESIPRTAVEQFEHLPHVKRNHLRPGDLVFVALNGTSTDWRQIDHVGIYAGHGNWVVAPHTGTVVQLQRIWTPHFWAARPR